MFHKDQIYLMARYDELVVPVYVHDRAEYWDVYLSEGIGIKFDYAFGSDNFNNSRISSRGVCEHWRSK